MTIKQHIEELRSELKACLDAGELAQIERELQAAIALRETKETRVNDPRLGRE